MEAKRVGEMTVFAAGEDIVIPLSQDCDGVLYLVGAEEPDQDTPYVKLGLGIVRLVNWAIDQRRAELRPAGGGPGGAAPAGPLS